MTSALSYFLATPMVEVIG